MFLIVSFIHETNSSAEITWHQKRETQRNPDEHKLTERVRNYLISSAGARIRFDKLRGIASKT